MVSLLRELPGRPGGVGYRVGPPAQFSIPMTLPMSPNVYDPQNGIVINLAAHIRVDLSRRFSELAVFDARLYIRVRHIDEPA